MPQTSATISARAPLQSLSPSAVDVGQRECTRQTLENIFAGVAICGDLVVVVGGFVLAYWLRLASGLIPFFGNMTVHSSLTAYLKLILLGWVIVFVGMLRQNLFRYEYLNNPKSVLGKFLSVLSVSMFVFLAVSLGAKTDPPISRIFVLCAGVLIFLLFGAWRNLLGWVVRMPRFARLMQRRLLIVGWSSQAIHIRNATGANAHAVWRYIGWVKSTHDTAGAYENEQLGFGAELPELLRAHGVDVVLVADPKMTPNQVAEVANVCEREHVEFKMVPRFFEVLVSGLHASAIGKVPVLGVEILPLQHQFNRLLKRFVDIVGALLGLFISAPIIAVCGLLVYLEAPGRVLFGQERIGMTGLKFKMFKIRSMKLDAEKSDHLNQSTLREDSRVLRIGKFMRKWNLDETPQFFNVLRGDMSLVGPRPERTFHSTKLGSEIPHYNLRYSCKPGMTGWAQVNGWRGNTDLEERIQHDIWYVENWNLWLDFKIMLMTFVKQENAY